MLKPLFKPDIFYLEGFSFKIFQTAAIAFEIENQLIGIKRLGVESAFFVEFVIAVFSVARKGMTDGGKVSTNLVGAPCFELDLCKTVALKFL